MVVDRRQSAVYRAKQVEFQVRKRCVICTKKSAARQIHAYIKEES